jgi:beta-arrestin
MLLFFIPHRDLVAELPFILMHSKPPEESPPPTRPATTVPSPKMDVDQNVAVDTNLIQLDT